MEVVDVLQEFHVEEQLRLERPYHVLRHHEVERQRRVRVAHQRPHQPREGVVLVRTEAAHVFGESDEGTLERHLG